MEVIQETCSGLNNETNKSKFNFDSVLNTAELQSYIKNLFTEQTRKFATLNQKMD